MKKLPLILTMLASVLLTSCLTSKDEKEYKLSFHEYSKSYKKGYIKIEYRPDEYVYVNSKPAITDAFFSTAKVYEVDGNLGMQVQLTNHGTHIWMQRTSVMKRGEQIVILLDGKYRNYIVVNGMNTMGKIDIPPLALKNKEVHAVLKRGKENFNQNFMKY